MASKVDLATFLRGDDDGIEAGLHAWASGKEVAEVKGSLRVLLRFFPPGSSGYMKTSDFVVDSVDTFDANNVVTRVEADIQEKVGSNPIGRMHFFLYGKVNGQHTTLFQRQRRIVPVEEDSGSLERAMLLNRVNSLENLTLEMGKTNAAIIQSLAAQNAELIKGIGVLATTRTATTSAADASSWASIVGMAIVLVGVPVFQKTIGLPVGASLDDTITAGRIAMSRLMGWINNEKRAEEAERGEIDGRPEAPEGAATKQITDAMPEDLRPVHELMRDLMQNPEYRETVVKNMAADPNLSEAIRKTYIKAEEERIMKMNKPKDKPGS